LEGGKMEFHHISVLLNQSIEALNIKPDGIYVDATLGGAGHSLEICRLLNHEGRLIGIDQDKDAIEAAKDRLRDYKDRITLVHDNFSNIRSILRDLRIDKIDGVIMDLGVSSHQLDVGERGFSYQHDAVLDMRMNREASLSAYQVVNEYSEQELARVIQDYGEEKWAKKIAKFIVQERQKKAIRTTGELVEIIKKAIPASARREGSHPAKRTFQAIRIEVNGELAVLEQAVRNFVDLLNTGGRMAVITFHSLEDRIVKQTFQALAAGCECPPSFPVCICGKKPVIQLVNRKPILPTEEELQRNPRSRSSKLRVVEKL